MVTLPMVLRGSRSLVAPLLVALALGSSHAAAAELDSATPEQKRAAQKMFEAGDELYEAGRFAEAAEAFRGSYGIVASPNSRLMLARALQELGKLAEAYAEYDGVAGEGTATDGRYAEARHAAEAERDALRPKLAWVTIRLPDDVGPTRRVTLSEQVLAVETLGSPAPATPGSVRVEVELSDGSTLTRDLKLAAGQQQTVDFGKPESEEAPMLAPSVSETAPAPPPAPAPRGEKTGTGLRTASYVAAGVGAVGLAGFGVFALMNRSTYRTLDADCPSGDCPPDRQSDIDAGQRYQLFANIGLGVAAAGVATGVVLFVLSRPSEKSAPSVALYAEPGGMLVEGQF
jgi:hypothetical protein